MFSFFNSKVSTNATDVTNEGPSISSTALGKVYGWFVEQLHTLYPLLSTQELISKYPHPVMCVIGCESTGKSATIESISKVPIFPSDTGICTRCPIKVVLMPTEPNTSSHYELSFRGKNKVYKDENLIDLKATIADIFQDVLKNSPTGIGYSDEVITIVVHRPDVIRMDFVDLPGIVSYPPEAKEFTLSLSQKYIDDPNCFILCVANATTPRLTSYEPIACIAAANACERSIIVLPMADKLSPKDFETHLLNRVTMDSDELRGQPFTACCAVVNRSSVSNCTLLQQAHHEHEWFRTNVLQPMEQGIAQSKAAQTTKREKTQCVAMERTLAQVTARLGIDMLLRVTNEKYEDYIKTRWMPRTLEEINKEITVITAERDQLGALPCLENLPLFRDDYSKHIHRKIWQLIEAGLHSELRALSEAEQLQVPSAAAVWGRIQTALQTLELSVIASLNIPEVAVLVVRHVHRAPVVHSSTYNALPCKWPRFQAAFVPCVAAAALRYLDDHLQPHFLLLYPIIHAERINKEASETWSNLVSLFAAAVKTVCIQALTLEHALVEDVATATLRAELTRKIAVHQGVQRALQEKVLAMDSTKKAK